jgi:hypothetical protein
MAEANGSGGRRAEDEDPDRTQRFPEIQAVVDRQFPDTDEQQGGDR